MDMQIYRSMTTFNKLIQNEMREYRNKGNTLIKAMKNNPLTVVAGGQNFDDIYVDKNFDWLLFSIQILCRTGANPYTYNQHRIRFQFTNQSFREDLFPFPCHPCLFSGNGQKAVVYDIPILMNAGTRYRIAINNDEGADVQVQVIFEGQAIRGPM